MPMQIRAALIAGAALLVPEPGFAEPLTLEEAVSRAVAASPELQARGAGVAAARAGQVQAGLRPNPILSVEAENLAGTGDYSVFEQPELTVTYGGGSGGVSHSGSAHGPGAACAPPSGR